MRAYHGNVRHAIAEADPDALLRMRTAAADAAFVAEGIAMGLPLKWIERTPLTEDRPPLVPARRAPDGGTRVSADH
jgi:hypothetical protein